MYYRYYLRILSIFYAMGAVLHLLDILGLRLNFWKMTRGWQFWIVYLLISDTIAAAGLWKQKSWGIFMFLIVACSQLTAYLGLKEFFGPQKILVFFHFFSLSLFCLLQIMLRMNKQKD